MVETADQVKAQLWEWLNVFKRTGPLPITPDEARIARYSRKHQTCQLALILDEVEG
jgi:hypothetical protein